MVFEFYKKTKTNHNNFFKRGTLYAVLYCYETGVALTRCIFRGVNRGRRAAYGGVRSEAGVFAARYSYAFRLSRNMGCPVLFSRPVSGGADASPSPNRFARYSPRWRAFLCRNRRGGRAYRGGCALSRFTCNTARIYSGLRKIAKSAVNTIEQFIVALRRKGFIYGNCKGIF